MPKTLAKPKSVPSLRPSGDKGGPFFLFAILEHDAKSPRVLSIHPIFTASHPALSFVLGGHRRFNDHPPDGLREGLAKPMLGSVSLPAIAPPSGCSSDEAVERGRTWRSLRPAPELGFRSRPELGAPLVESAPAAGEVPGFACFVVGPSPAQGSGISIERSRHRYTSGYCRGQGCA